VHIISAVEACDGYQPWPDKQTHRTFLRPDTGKCRHYYFYFMDAELGLVYLRVPTPACAGAGSGVGDAGGIFHRSRLSLASRADAALRAAGPTSCARRQGRARRHLPGSQDYPAARSGSRQPFRHAHRSTCIKHRFGKSAIKMCDKFALVLRLETTSNEVSSFKHHRKVEPRKGPATRALAPVKKTIYSLREILVGCNCRYLAFLSALDDFSAGLRALDRLTKPRAIAGKTVKGINFFNPTEQRLLRALQRPAFNIAGNCVSQGLTLSPLSRGEGIPDSPSPRSPGEGGVRGGARSSKNYWMNGSRLSSSSLSTTIRRSPAGSYRST
jgi:hypothetical protein